MQHSLIVIDGLLPEAEALRLRAQAIEAEYAPYRAGGWPEENALKRVSQAPMPGVRQALEDALREPCEALFWGFRLDYAGELPVRPVHFDSECGGWAMVLYLNLPHQCRGGTAFWRHVASGVEAVPPGAAADCESWYHGESDNSDAWDLGSVVGMRFNRAVVYPTRYFHSRWPLEGFGSSPENGRLIGGLFFNLGHRAPRTMEINQ